MKSGKHKEKKWHPDRVEGRSDGKRRGVAWLRGNNEFDNAKASFEGLSLDEKRALCTAFDYYVDGHDNKSKRHHGWDSTQHKGRHTNCHVFKHSGTGARIYGFKCNPRKEAPRFQLCLLVHFARKHQDKTEQNILDRLEALRNDAEVVEAINDLLVRERMAGEKDE